MSARRTRSANQVQSWIRACEKAGADGIGQLTECVYEMATDKHGPNIPRDLDARITRQTRRSRGLPVRNPRTGRIR